MASTTNWLRPDEHLVKSETSDANLLRVGLVGDGSGKLNWYTSCESLKPGDCARSGGSLKAVIGVFGMSGVVGVEVADPFV